MTGPEEIAEVFGILHDGCIAGGTTVDHAVELVVEIEYLARRIRPTDRKFLVRIDGLEQVSFTPWSDDGRTVVPAITGFVGIASLGLGVLSAEAEGSRVRIACTQDRPGLGYCGGFLEMEAGRCRVFDESGREWSLEELRTLSDGYWREWAARNA